MATRNRIEIEIGARNNATRELTNAAKSLRDLESTFTKISTLFAGGMAGGMIASAIGGTITKFASLGEELGKLRVATGLTYGQLQTLQRALEEAGTAPEALNTATRILNVNIAQGDKTLAKYGITARDTYGAILQVGKRLAGLGSSAEKAELGMAAFGRSSQDLIDTISRFATDPDMRRGLEAVSLSDAQVEKFQKLDERLDKAGRAWKRLFNEIAGAIEPVASTLLGTINLITELEAKGDADTYRRMAEMRFRTGSAGALMFSAHGQNAVPPPIKTTPSGGTSPERTFYGNLPAQYGYGPPTAPAGWGTERLRTMARMWGQNLPGMVPEPMNTFQSGKLAGLERTQAALRTFTSGVESAFSGMFSRVFGVTTRSNNIIVQLFADLANSVVNAVGQRIGSAIGNFAITAVGAAFGIPTAAATTGGTVIVNTLESKSLVDAMLTPSGSLRQANARMAQIAAVR